MTEYRKHDSSASNDDIRNMYFQGIDLEDKKILNVGCGNDYVDGWVNLDGDKSVKADIHADLEDETDLRVKLSEDVYDVIYCSHILEHIHNLVSLKKLLLGALKPHGLILVVVPYYLSKDAWGDDTHCRAFSEESFNLTFWPGIKEGTIKMLKMQKQQHEVTWIAAYLTKGEKE